MASEERKAPSPGSERERGIQQGSCALADQFVAITQRGVFRNRLPAACRVGEFIVVASWCSSKFLSKNLVVAMMDGSLVSSELDCFWFSAACQGGNRRNPPSCDVFSRVFADTAPRSFVLFLLTE